MEAIFIEIPHGEDIVERIIQYAQHREANITVLSASGLVSNVILHSSNLPIEGPVYMTSLSGIFIADLPHSSFSICFSNNDGQLFGGIVGGPIIAADVIYVKAVIFNEFDVVDTIQSDSNSDSN
jgi:predicted DNA-binding protein with PD1-like motif